MGGCVAHLHQLHFQGFVDGTEAGAASIAAVDTNFSRDVDTIFGMRFEIEESANCSSMNNQFHLQRNLLGAGWVDVTTASTVVQLVDGTATDGEVTTDRIAGSAKTFVAGEVDEDGVTANITLQNQHTEMLFVVQIVGADVTDQDTIQFRAITGTSTLDELHATPTVTASKAGGPQTFQETIAATATGTATMTRQTGKGLTATAVGSAALVRQTRKTLRVTAAGSALLASAATLRRTLSATAIGTASLQSSRLQKVTLAATAVVSAVLATRLTLGQSVLATAVGIATLVTVYIAVALLAATAVGNASLSRSIKKTLVATATGVVTLTKRVALSLSATAIGAAVLAPGATIRQLLSAAATGAASLTATFQEAGAGNGEPATPVRMLLRKLMRLRARRPR